ncbi:hypothetical protein J2P12_08280, partial [Candidatus Bathyarchaeota archaeon]|nr:hypothetical protein [Candidatus Bathyarchaeota archaeon]
MKSQNESPGTRSVLVIHPRLSAYAGGELLALWTCKILQQMEYHVTLVADVFEPSRVEEVYGMGEVLTKCRQIQMPRPHKRMPFHLEILTRLLYVVRLAKFAKSLNAMDFKFVLSTQSSIFSFPGKRLYHFVYGIEDLFRYPIPLIAAPGARVGRLKRLYLYFLRSIYRRLAPPPLPNWFFADGLNLLKQLQRIGYSNSSFFYPPSRVFKPRLPKKNQVIQVSRVVPEKRIEVLFEIARKLPSYKFILVGKNLGAERNLNPGYYEKLFSKRPRNVSYIEIPIIQNAELLE